MTCKHCVGGYVRKFRAATKDEKAGWYDEKCSVCKGDWLKIEPLPKRKITKRRTRADECPF